MDPLRHTLLAMSLVALAACTPKGDATKAAAPVAGEVQAVATSPADPAVVEMERLLDQGWTPANRQVWYERTQGSRLIPLSWALALEDEAGQPFLGEANVKRWGYLPHVNRQGRALPIGFTEDVRDETRLPQPVLAWRKTPTAADRVWLGMNCSACHTAQLTYQGKTLTVDGGPALSDFEGFLRDLRAALQATDKDDARFGRFADRVLGDKPLTAFTPGPNPVDKLKDLVTTSDSDDKANRAMLRAALGKIIAREQELVRLNASTGESDYGRLDAFGHIFNKVAMIAQPPGRKIQAPSPSDAPVSYPFLWNVPQHDQVQWNGIAPNTVLPSGRQIGALARNAGEVVGVFGDIEVGPALKPWRSSIDVKGLELLEAQLAALRPPAWPDTVLGWGSFRDPKTGETADHAALVARGAELYGAPGKPGRCIACHELLPNRKDLQTRFKAQMALFNPAQVGGAVHRSTGTDIGMACNAFIKTAKGGLMAGQVTDAGHPIRKDGESLALMLKHSVIRALLGQSDKAVEASKAVIFPPGISQSLLAALAGGGAASTLPPEQRCLSERNAHLGYKGRPLNGIWATAPYLHNGSVRTLYQLLLPPADREPTFEVGNREFDPKDVGYVSSAAGAHSTFRTTAKGNSNAGHDYGNAKLSDRDRYALIEFMKTL